jgi:hypothetical protein
MPKPEQLPSEERLKQAKESYKQAEAHFLQAIAEASQAFLGSSLDDTVPPQILDQPPKPFREP